jgi:Chaperone of endosialidase
MTTTIKASMLESNVAKNDIDNSWSADQTFTNIECVNLGSTGQIDAARIIVGEGGGALGMTTNDGYGNCNLTFNHNSGIPDYAGNLGRVTVNTDSTTAMTMIFQGKSNSGTAAVAGSEMARMEADSGDFTAIGDVSAFSDERVKIDWEDLPENFIELLADVLMGSYGRTDRPNCDKRQVGVGAQSLRKFMPEAVHGDESVENLRIAYGNAAMASCVQLAREVLVLRKRLDRQGIQ